MTRAEARELLKATSPHQRLSAATFFLSEGSEQDLVPLQQARQSENDRYVLRRLEQAIGRIHMAELPTDQAIYEASVTPTDQNSLARSIEWVGGLLLHEMEGPIGRAALYASKELEGYNESKTKKEIDALKSVFGGIEQLVNVSQAPRPVEFDLAAMIDDVAATVLVSSNQVSIYGVRPFLVISDPHFIRLALVNGLRNAAEAIERVGASNLEHPIVITWGSTDRDQWLSIIDHGPGIKGSIGQKFELGSTTKPGHRGFGLAIARRAMEALSGSASLQSAGATGGAKYELRWRRSS